MIAIDHGVARVEKTLQARDEVEVERIGAAEVQQQAVADQGPLRGDVLECVTKAATYAEPVLRRDFKKCDFVGDLVAQRTHLGPP